MKRALLVMLLASPVPAADVLIPAKIEYNRDIRPLLADTCFKCHGFDQNTREADLRLDVRETAIAKIDDIYPIVPGKPDESEIWRRITTKDEDDRMPPEKANRQLSAREKQIIRKWIEQGAEYQPHWAFIAPVAADVRRQADQAMAAAKSARLLTSSATNPIDAFVAARHAQLGLVFAPEADRATLCRRLHLDLLGLPPGQAAVDAFVNDQRPDAYERLLGQLLASAHFGERMAVWWLDLVRYADTIGYHSDNPRNVWPYRDYVIRAFNDNMRFDQFTIEQVAGDLLPNAGLSQKVASGYNRLTLTTEEGGAQAKQYEAKSVVDRVKSIGTTWLAQTYMCAECHDHKYDPVTARDFYSLGAFFADIKESAIGRREEGMLVPMPEQEAKLKEFDAGIAALQKRLAASSPELERAQSEWEAEAVQAATHAVPWKPLHPVTLTATKRVKLAADAGGVIRADGGTGDAGTEYRIEVKGGFSGVTGFRLEAMADPKLPATGPGRAGNGNFVLTEFGVAQAIAGAEARFAKLANAAATFEQAGFPAAAAIDGNSKEKLNGWAVMGGTGVDQAIYFELAEPISATEKETLVFTLHFGYGENHVIGKFRLAATTVAGGAKLPKQVIPPGVAKILSLEPGKRTGKQRKEIADHYRTLAPLLVPLRTELAEKTKQRADFERGIGRCLVSESSPSLRTVRILPRGDWMSDKGDIVEPATPAYLPGAPKPADGKRLTRLDLARWLVSRENPLTARVFVNRLWKQFYGIGLVKTLEDAGTQGELPVNQPLLDWLAVEFMDSGWDVKHMVRLMVGSGVYRQGSTAPRDAQQRDPFNRELARQGRWRIDAEFVRDNALGIAGLLVHKLGGPSVKPYQPGGYWENLNFPAREWEDDKNENQWRRGLYVWWQRSYAHPAMLAFDAPTREECAADRVRSNIPQQALVLLNDPEYVEAARAFAARILKQGGATAEARLTWAWREATGRTPAAAEIGVLQALLRKHLADFSQDAKTAEALLKVGYSPAKADGAGAELAAYTSVARALLNMHETITRL